MALRPAMKGEILLNQVFNLQRFSLANYLRFAGPWSREPDHVLLEVLCAIAQVQDQNAARVGELLSERHASPRPGNFPTRFTGLNDISVRHAAPHVVEDLERTIYKMSACLEAHGDDSTGRDIVQAILLDEQQNLKILREELDHVPAGETSGQLHALYLKPSAPAMNDAYGAALDRWTNEGGALGENPYAVHFSRSLPTNGRRSEPQPAPEFARNT